MTERVTKSALMRAACYPYHVYLLLHDPLLRHSDTLLQHF